MNEEAGGGNHVVILCQGLNTGTSMFKACATDPYIFSLVLCLFLWFSWNGFIQRSSSTAMQEL